MWRNLFSFKFLLKKQSNSWIPQINLFSWLICLLYAIKLRIYDGGATTGPSTFSGRIVKYLKNSTTKKVVNFQPITTELSSISSDLGTDKKYHFNMCQAVLQLVDVLILSQTWKYVTFTMGYDCISNFRNLYWNRTAFEK